VHAGTGVEDGEHHPFASTRPLVTLGCVPDPSLPSPKDERHDQKPRARRAGGLGPVDWILLVVILLAVGVTLAMAIFNPW
jgi:hypothetical protein